MSMRIKGAAWPAGAASPARAYDDMPAHVAPEVPPEVALDAPADAARRPADAFDAERVAALRIALAQGRIPFDAAKLAALILHRRRGRR